MAPGDFSTAGNESAGCKACAMFCTARLPRLKWLAARSSSGPARKLAWGPRALIQSWRRSAPSGLLTRKRRAFAVRVGAAGQASRQTPPTRSTKARAASPAIVPGSATRTSKAAPSKVASRCQRVSSAARSSAPAGISSATSTRHWRPSASALRAAMSSCAAGSSPSRTMIGIAWPLSLFAASSAAVTACVVAAWLAACKGSVKAGRKRWARRMSSSLIPLRKCSTRSSMRRRPAARPALSSTSSSRQRRKGRCGVRALQCGESSLFRARLKLTQGRCGSPWARAQRLASSPSISAPAQSSSKSRSKVVSPKASVSQSIALSLPSALWASIIATAGSMGLTVDAVEAGKTGAACRRCLRRANSASSSC